VAPTNVEYKFTKNNYSPYMFVITGGSGFVGQNLVKFFDSQGYTGLIVDKTFPSDVEVVKLIKSARWGEKIMRATTVFLDNALKGKPICIYGDGSDLRDYIFISDAARAIVQGIRKKKSGIYNLSGGEPVSIKSLAEKIVRLSGKGIDIIYKERVQNKKNIHLENKKIKEEIDFVPLVSLDEGLEIQYNSLLEGIYD